jgi:hypothetical protein
MDAVDRLIKHLDGTKTLAIEFSKDNIEDTMIFATDAAYADNRDRKSSEGYIMRMFGGVVDWKATKQKTVTTYIDYRSRAIIFEQRRERDILVDKTLQRNST